MSKLEQLLQEVKPGQEIRGLENLIRKVQ